MKKLFILLAAAVMAINVMAQETGNSKREVRGVNLYIGMLKSSILDGDEFPLATDSVFASFDEEYFDKEWIPCISNAIIVSGDKELSDEELKYYTKAQNKPIVHPFEYPTNIVVLSSQRDTLLKIKVHAYNEQAEFLAYSKLYKDLADRPGNPLFLRATGTFLISTETGEAVQYLWESHKYIYNIVDNDPNTLYCAKEEVHGNYNSGFASKTWYYYPNGVKREYLEYDWGRTGGVLKAHIFYDRTGRIVKF